MSKSNNTQCPAAPANQSRRIGRAERDFVFSIVEFLHPRMARLGRDKVVGSNAKVEALIEVIPLLGETEYTSLERVMPRLRGEELKDAAKRLTTIDELGDTWRKRLEEAQAADEANRAEREAQKAKADDGAVKLGDALSEAEKAALQATVSKAA